MSGPLTPRQILLKAQRWCASAERCAADVHARILAWGGDERTAAEVIASLRAERYLDDRRYCRAFVLDRWRFCGWGRVKLREALRHKGLPGGCIEEALGEIDEREYISGLRSLIARKAEGLTAASEYERRAKLARYAAGKGYELELVMRVIGGE